jgi:DNA-directed RNA polymerase subunit RPC12/RpoP
MVDLVVPQCPRCGADIELRPDGTAGVCRYCDAQVLVLDGAPHPSETEIERRKEALAMLRQDLAELEGQAARASFQIQAAQSGGRPARAGAAVLPMVLFGLMMVFSAMMTPLFYFLEISYVWGVSQSMCPVVGALFIIVGAAGLVGTKLGADRFREQRRAQAMQSPEYYAAVQQLSMLQPRIQMAREAADRADRELRALVLGPQGL